MASSSSSSAATAAVNGFTHDVFLSFRGTDTRYGFTGHLYKALCDKGFRTFIDDEELHKGEDITPSLLKAIQDSRIAIVVLSRNYASSSFCLDEFSKIVDCFEEKGQLVWPVFYDVDPSDVRKLSGTYGEAMAMHEERFKDQMERLQKWRKSLQKVANLSGWHFKHGDEYEHEFIEKIVEEVSRNIKCVALHVADYPVGLESQILDVNLLLDIGFDDRVLMVGIHGIGGLGKTTLALSVYNSIAHHFEGLCFLENVRENSNRHGLLHLQKTLLSELGKEEKLTSVKQGHIIIQQRLQQKKVLLILDDVDNQEQLQAVAGSPEWFGPGSRVIITTRDKHLLACHGVDRKYEVRGLNKKDAFELLARKAFQTLEVSRSYVDILDRAVTYASGLPLALEVIGSHLFKKSIEEWKSALDRYERIPIKEIQKILEVSYDALDKEEKSVFLDIACCFKGYNLAKVKELLHAHYGDNKVHHIGVLVEKSLIKISESDVVILHDLIEDMGKEIVRQESPEEPGKRSRLWFHKDVVHVLEGNTGTSKIEIICLDIPTFEEVVEQKGEAFKKMEKLKTLIVRNAYFSKKFKDLPNSLRVLEWDRYSTPALGLPFDFHPKKVSTSKLRSSCFTSFKSANLENKKFENMRVLILDNSQPWKMPDVSGLPNLEVWSLKHCHIESQIYNSVVMLDKLRILCASFCKYLRDFPSLNLPSLEELDLSYCVSLESFPPVVGSLGKLKILNIEGCEKLKNFPPLKLPSLEKLNISSCDSLESFSHEVWLLDKLKIMHASHCPKLRSFPPLKLASLEELFLSNCESLESFPSEVGSLGKLRIFLAGGCRKLKKFPSLELPSLQELDISFCESLESFTPVVGLLDKLKILRANGCNRLWSFPLLQLVSLEQLDLSYCESLGNNPEILGKMENIIHIRLHKTPMKKLPFSIHNLTRLQTLYLSNCGIVELPSSIALMSKLAELTIEEGGWLFAKQDKGEEYVSPMQTSKVEVLNLLNCNLSDEYLAIGLTWFANVKELDLSGSRFTIVPECIKECRFLWKLVLNGCERLREIREIPPSLKTFSALNCTSLTSSSRRKLLNQELHEAGNTNFLLAQSCIPKWFDHQINTQSFSLWFRNKLPAIALYFISWNNSKSAVRMIINGTSFFYRDGKNEIKRQLETHHLHIFHMQMENFNDNLDKALVENEWNHAEVRIDDDTFPVLIWGIHVLKEKTSMEDVRLNDVSFRSGGPPIEDLPFSFQSLSGLRKLYLVKCGNIQLPSSICMLRKLTKLSIEYGGWQLLKQDGDEEEGSTMRPLNVKYLCLKRCILSDESLAIGLKWFANVKELDLSGSVFSVLSECIKECRFLRKLILDGCKGLEEIREIPPCLKSLSALNCESLTSSSKSMLLNQELHEAGNTRFRLPRVWIPNWFDHQCMQGQLMSFWFQNKFPAVVIGVVSPLSWNNSKSPVRVIFNGNPFFYRDGGSENKRQPETYHLHLFHMQMEKFNSNLDKALLEKEPCGG